MVSAMKRCTSRMLTASSMPVRRQRLSQGCWQTRPVEAGSGLSITTDSKASSRRSSLYSWRKRGMFMCSGQLFSQGESARSSQTPARQRLRADVVLELVPEVPHGGQHRVGRGLPEAAQRRVADHAAQLVQSCRGPPPLPSPSVNAFRMLQRLVEAHAAGDALAAGLRVGELDEVARHVHHAVVFVHHHHAARAHDGAELAPASRSPPACRTSPAGCSRPTARRSARP